MLACLLRSGVDREPHIHALVIAAQRDLLLGKRATGIRGQIRTTQRDRPAIAACGGEGESGGCLSRSDGKRAWVRGRRITTIGVTGGAVMVSVTGGEVLAAMLPAAAYVA
jgi:hypothetical protein